MSMGDFKEKVDKIVNFFLKNQNGQAEAPVKKATAKKTENTKVKKASSKKSKGS